MKGGYVVETCWDGNWRLIVDDNSREPFTFESIEEAWQTIESHYGTDQKNLFRVRER